MHPRVGYDDAHLGRSYRRIPTLADFGLNMTIGIAAITIPDGNIVTVSDRMLSSGDIVQATDDAALKARKISKTWALLMAAEDANLFLPIVKAAQRKLLRFEERYDLEIVQNVVVESYRELFDTEFTSHHLARYGITNLTEFRTTGLAQFGGTKFRSLCEKVDKFELGITMLGYGFDTKGAPHIFEVLDPGAVTNHDLLGYAVIGSGCYMATASLRRKQLPTNDLELMIYRLLEAKFSAETASGVGKSTNLFTMNADGDGGHIGWGTIGKIRDIWEKTLKIREPEEAIELIRKSPAVTRIVNGER